MSRKSFHLHSAHFTMDDELSQEIKFLGPSANTRKTHITLIAGANGTSKSRLLASIVDRLCELNEEESGNHRSRRYGAYGHHGLDCTAIHTHTPNEMPSKVLVLSNLVMDRFRYVNNDPLEENFYQYLGVRQATNLTTTGSMERAVSEAVISLFNNKNKRRLFQKWVRLVFGGSREIALHFDRTSRSQLERIVQGPNNEEDLFNRMIRTGGSARRYSDEVQASFREAVPEILKFFEFLLEQAENVEGDGKKKKFNRRSLFLRLNTMSDQALNELTRFSHSFGPALRTRLFSWPSVLIEENALIGWRDFGQLSSGEQNILSTGAKLIAHAEPGCLIAIDEPEVSLNISWQQHYTDLVSQSLSQAPGSHVLIATHSPHLIASLPTGEASVLLLERKDGLIEHSTIDAEFEGWGAEAILYQVLDIPSASNFEFQRELASILLQVQNRSKDRAVFEEFLEKTERLNFEGAEALEAVVNSIRLYRDSLK